jgi:hypothetical protein
MQIVVVFFLFFFPIFQRLFFVIFVHFKQLTVGRQSANETMGDRQWS